MDDEKKAVDGHPVSKDITWHATKVKQEERRKVLRADPSTVWLTGFSGSGKSTIAYELERKLIAMGYPAFVLDGDNVRHGLNRDLGFTPQDRTENIRRVAEVAKLFNDAGMLVITSFISPYRQDRALAAQIIGKENFIETYLSTPIEVCEERDPKGLYKKVRQGKVAEFTGISAPYEAPDQPSIEIDTSHWTLEQCVVKVLQLLTPRLH